MRSRWISFNKTLRPEDERLAGLRLSINITIPGRDRPISCNLHRSYNQALLLQRELVKILYIPSVPDV
uniref:Uncharacterized protein n=1 Tax=Physcomitrium patens TaxID=3218 RepID=A0A2K1KPW2_PHYPA|nr:hypothetical protein PHYPA_006722 [Physcomitrium patens]